MKRNYSILFLTLVFFAACTSENESTKRVEKTDTESDGSQELIIEFDKVYSWVNLMPGPDAKPSFHITGEIKLFESGAYNLSELQLAQINIYQNNETVFSFKPDVRLKENLSAEKVKLLVFSTITGLFVKNNLNYEKPVDAKFIFKHNSELFSYTVNDIKIEKAY